MNRKNRHIQPKKKENKASKPYVPIISVYENIKPLVHPLPSLPFLNLTGDYLSILEKMTTEELVKTLKNPSLKSSEARMLFERLQPHQRRALLEERALHEYSASAADANTGGYDGGGPKAFSSNYPPGLAFTTGLIGWYDASQLSSIVKDGSNNISEWKNLFRGKKPGDTVLPSLVPASESLPTYVTNQSYTWNVNSGTRPGVFCYSDGNNNYDGQTLAFSQNLGSLFNTKTLLIVMAVKTQNLNGSGYTFTLFDSSINYYEQLTMFIDKATLNQNSITFGSNNGNSVAVDTGTDFVKGLQVVPNGSNYEWSGIYGSTSGNAVNIESIIGGTYDPPWDSILIGDQTGGGISTLVGEILIYNYGGYIGSTGTYTSGDMFNIQSYLYNKWK